MRFVGRFWHAGRALRARFWALDIGGSAPTTIATMSKRKIEDFFAPAALAPAKKTKLPAPRSPLSETSANIVPVLAPARNTTIQKNLGGASKLEWYNPLINDPRLASVRSNLFNKISAQGPSKKGHPDCVKVVGFDETTRPVVDKAQLARFRSIAPDAPARYSPYVIALAKVGVRLPEKPPPAYPRELRQVKQKRAASAAEGNEKEATWVVSHLCHNRECVNTDHLTWEPSWFNRLRDNCSGGDACGHRPFPCLRSHRGDLQIVDWTTYK